MKRKAMIGTVAVAAVAALCAAAVYASPYWVVRELKEAARERDVDALLEHVDAQALRRSVRLAMGFRVEEQLLDSTDEDRRPAGPAAAQAARALVDPLSDTLTSPTLLMSMLIQGRPSELLAPGMRVAPLTSVAQASELALAQWDATIQYVDWSTVLVGSKRTPNAGDFVLKRAGLVDWKLSGFRMPGQ
ncbi:DUF2939 domain-containing protein [Variovorax sp. J22R133]|uniref:DUF2939 domain-containing protein n=1 Tax=Variovorax brevis TaxID=3053503 RepID=UPI002578076B|nr:DUF2939 domain-containing protein [Variovorax sp. J22R133]MDM0111074.1 DUF2939 domain-containing protein [Variovorax sp. J22R133]